MSRKPTQAQADYAAYLERCAELDRRIADGETITEIMRSEQLERGRARIAEILEQDRQDRGESSAASDPLGALEQLGAVWSPDLDAYLAGERDSRRLRCALCGKAPCECRECQATYENRYYLATGRPQFEPCGMRIDPATGECPRGHAAAR